MSLANTGSPPRLWGIWRMGGWPPMTVAVHPHACGEYDPEVYLFASSGGSPPRLWGILPTEVAQNRDARFTPTPVGNMHRTRSTIRNNAVHPHACGEYGIAIFYGIGNVGSPPRLWGIWSITVNVTCRRLVHPHACGEYEHLEREAKFHIRFTPTPVGNM